MIRLRLLDPVEVNFYPAGAPAPALTGLAYPYLIDPGASQADADYRSGGNVPSYRVTLENRAGEATVLLNPPPRRAQVYDDATLIFDGAIGSISLADTATLELVA